LIERLGGSHAAVLHVVARQVAHDLEEPGGKSIGVAALLEPLERPHPRILANVLGIGMIRQHRQRNRMRRPRMPADEAFERGRIS